MLIKKFRTPKHSTLPIWAVFIFFVSIGVAVGGLIIPGFDFFAWHFLQPVGFWEKITVAAIEVVTFWPRAILAFLSVITGTALGAFFGEAIDR